MSKRVAVLFARKRSIYKKYDAADVWDINRDARNYRGYLPVVAHPPCRGWGKLRGLAKPRPDEKDLALFAVEAVRKYGGVLEHPAFSTLWKAANLPPCGKVDEFGGFTVPVLQSWFGHRAEKATWLYVCGIQRSQIPEIPFRLGDATHVISTTLRRGHPRYRPSCSKAERERTPALFAEWLLSLAESCAKFGVTPELF